MAIHSHTTDFFAPALPADTLRSTKLRIEPVVGDSMAPTLRGGHDFALVQPIDSYAGEGIYLVSTPFGSEFFRAEGTLDGTRQIRLWRDNPHYSDRFVSKDHFDEAVLAKVVADVKVRDIMALQAVLAA